MGKSDSAFLEFCRPFVKILPELPKPTVRLSFNERMKWTIAALGIFLVCCEIPVFGATPPDSSDPFYWMRVVLASNKGSLMEFGISPIVTASMIMQIMSVANLIEYDEKDKDQQKLWSGAQKVVGIFILLLEVVAYVASGMYGNLSDIGYFVGIGIVLQLIISCVICIMLDELLTSGWGYGSGISLFIAVNICETILWKMFSPISVNVGKGTEVEGAVIALFQLLLIRPDKSRALIEAIHRPQLPNITNVLATLLIFLVVVFLQGFHKNILCTDRRQGRSQTIRVPIKLFYTSNTPIILQASMLANLFFISKLMYQRLGNDNLIVALLGRWEEPEYAGNESFMVPVGGLAYYLSAPNSTWQIWEDPIRALVYMAFMLASCGALSRVWIEVSGSSSLHVARRLKENNLVLKNHNQGGDEKEVVATLNKYIPVAAAFGGMCVGLLSVMGDFLGAIGSGTGILLASSTIADYVEIIMQERSGNANVKKHHTNQEVKLAGN